MLVLKPTASIQFKAVNATPSIFPPPPDTRNPFVAFFEDNWRIIVSVVEFVVSVALIPFTAGLSLAAATAVQVGFDVTTGVLDSVLDYVETGSFNAISLLNFAPLAISGLGLGIKAIAKGLGLGTRTSLTSAQALAKEVQNLTDDAIKAGDFKNLGFRVFLEQRVPTLNKAGRVSFEVDASVVRKAGTIATDKQVLVSAFRQNLYSSEKYANVFRTGETLDKGSFWYMSNVIEDKVAEAAGKYTKQIQALREAIAATERQYRTSSALYSEVERLARFKSASSLVVKHYKAVKRTIGQIKYLFELPSKLIKLAIKVGIRAMKRVPFIARGIERFGKTRLGRLLSGRAGLPITKATAKAAVKGDALVRSLNMIPIDSSWIMGVKIRPKFTNTEGTIGTLVRIAEVGEIPDDPSWFADVFILFDPSATAHSGKLAGRPHEKWGIVGPGEPRGKRQVKLYMNGAELKDLLENYVSFGSWYYNTGRNLARETTLQEIAGAVGSVATHLAGVEVGSFLGKVFKATSFGFSALKEVMYWRTQVQFVYARILQIQNGTFFERMVNPNKLRSLATRSLVSAVFRAGSFGNMAYRFGYALANNNAKGLLFLTEKNIRSINRHHSSELKRIRGLINTGRRIASPNFTKLIKPVKVRSPSVRRK